MNSAFGLIAVLVILGAGWGATQPLSKIALSTDHSVIGVMAWQMVIGSLLLGVLMGMQGKRLPLRRHNLMFYAIIALIGTLLPGMASYTSLRVLPSGIISILLSTVPMIAFPVAIAMGLERFEGRRFLGLLFGLAGVMLIVVPEASLPERAMLAFIPLALIAPAFYGFEGNFVSRFGTGGVDALTLIMGASLMGACLLVPWALMTGQWVAPAAGRAELALVGSAVAHNIVYVGYVWLIGRAGSVFAAQVSYLVTGFGVIWAMLLLGERFAPTVWAAMAVMFLGLLLVRPRPRIALAPDGPAAQS